MAISHKKIQLTIVSQERQLLSTEVTSVTLPTVNGEITILPNHIPLLSQLETGELVYRQDDQESSFVISRGFLDMNPDNELTIIVDAAKHVRDLSEQKAQAAIDKARETMAVSTNQRELLLAEASLRQALWEIKVAQKTKKAKI